MDDGSWVQVRGREEAKGNPLEAGAGEEEEGRRNVGVSETTGRRVQEASQRYGEVALSMMGV